MHIYLVRHAESLPRPGKPADGELIGLTTKGRKQARRIAAYLKHRKIDMLISSPLTRAKETADAIHNATGVAPLFDDRVREFVPAQLPSPYFKEAREHARSDWEWVGEGGESCANSIARLSEVLASLPKGKRVAIVTHELLMQNFLLSRGLPCVMIPQTGIIELSEKQEIQRIPSQTPLARLWRRLRDMQPDALW
jgi:broad specificity phosphatase PhoE